MVRGRVTVTVGVRVRVTVAVAGLLSDFTLHFV